jgi:hypothetical protein
MPDWNKMEYKLYTDRNENFECEVSVKNASLKGSLARLVVESADNINLIFNGRIEGEKCIVPVRRLKGILDENSRGKMHLELVVEDTYFKPWESDFVVEEHTSVKVKVNEQTTKSNKPIVEVKVPTPAKSVPSKKQPNLTVPLKEISSLCSMFQLNKTNIRKKKGEFSQLLREYFNSNSEYKNHKTEILTRIGSFLK